MISPKRLYVITNGPYSDEQYADFYDTEDGELTFYVTDETGKPCAIRTITVGFWEQVYETAIVIPLRKETDE